MTAPTTKAPAERAEKFTASEMQRRLSDRYRLPQWAYFAEVRDNSGFNASRSADGLAFDTWKGHAIHGFEIKVARADWLRELEQPGKWEAVGQHCDHWWIVAAPGVVRAGELPAGWGLLLANGDGLRMEKPAPTRVPAISGGHVPRSLVALLFRRACEASPTAEALAAARAEGREQGRREAERTRDHSASHLEALRARVQKFEQAAGVKLDDYNGGDLAKAYALVRAGAVDRRREDAIRSMQYLADNLETQRRYLRETIAELRGDRQEGAT